VYNADYSLFDFNKEGWRSIIRDSGNSEGDFINQADLDSNKDILYTNASIGSSYRLYRFSDLTNIPEGGSASKTILQSSLLNSFPTALKVSPYTTDMTKLLVGTETGNLFSVQAADSNPVWEEITGPSFVGSISDIEFGANESEILVTFHNYGIDNIWWSSDGGSTWASKEGDLPDLPVKSILKNPLEPNEVIVGTELGVWKTKNWEDSVPNWEHAYNGMSDVKVTDLQYRKEGHTVLAATYGRGLFTGIFEANPLPLSIDEFVNDTSTGFPKGFSPNGDGSNDTWLLDHVAEMYPKHQIQIFNRSGVLVYDGKLSANSDWDGFSNVGSAEKLPVGTYYYRLNLGAPVAPFSEKSYPKKGVIYIKY
jgi:gliding motility-associated-like protein